MWQSCLQIIRYSLAAVSRGTEEVFQALEDNQVVLSTMKASHFVRAFEKEVDLWERRLSLVLEVIEMILTVQRQWIYLEVRPLLFSNWVESRRDRAGTRSRSCLNVDSSVLCFINS